MNHQGMLHWPRSAERYAAKALDVGCCVWLSDRALGQKMVHR